MQNTRITGKLVIHTTTFFQKKKRENTNLKSWQNIQNIWNVLKTED